MSDTTDGGIMMFSSRLIAGLVASIPLAMVMVVYWLVRSREFIAVLTQNGSVGEITNGQARGLFLGMFVLMAFGFGLASSFVYGWIGSKSTYLGLALGLATVFSVLAIISRTPLPWDKVFMNFAVAGVLGFLIPFLVIA